MLFNRTKLEMQCFFGWENSYSNLKAQVLTKLMKKSVAEMTKQIVFLQNAALRNTTEFPKPAWQWEATLPNGDVSMMLNTDFEMFFDLRKKNV